MVPRGDNKIAAKPLLHLFSDQWQEGKHTAHPPTCTLKICAVGLMPYSTFSEGAWSTLP